MPTIGKRKTRTHHRSLCETGRLDLRTSTGVFVSALALVRRGRPRQGEKSFEAKS